MDGLTAAVGSPEALRPLQPPLQRYKRDVAMKLQAQCGGGSGLHAATLPHAKYAVISSPCCEHAPFSTSTPSHAVPRMVAVGHLVASHMLRPEISRASYPVSRFSTHACTPSHHPKFLVTGLLYSGRGMSREGSDASSASGRPGSGGHHADAAASAAAAAAALSLESLTCRLCSLDHLLIRLPVLETSLHEKQVALLHLPACSVRPSLQGLQYVQAHLIPISMYTGQDCQ